MRALEGGRFRRAGVVQQQAGGIKAWAAAALGAAAGGLPGFAIVLMPILAVMCMRQVFERAGGAGLSALVLMLGLAEFFHLWMVRAEDSVNAMAGGSIPFHPALVVTAVAFALIARRFGLIDEILGEAGA